ncbi:sensor histidine kinase [Microbacterium sp.]|uniref:sensor histidine kinase n=1 Tax=Microbacterium sp. TaxID=51671 RepID=UPI003C7182F1
MTTEAARPAAERTSCIGHGMLPLVAVLAAVWAIGGAWIRVSTGWTGNHSLDFLAGGAYLAAGTYAVHRRPGNTVGALVLLFGVASFLTPWAFTIHPPLYGWAWMLLDSAPALLIHMVLVFPTGRAATRFARFVIVLGYAWLVIANFVAHATIDRAAQGYDEAVPTISLWPSVVANSVVFTTIQIRTPVLALLTVAAFTQRWMLATPAARRDLQPMWVVLGLGGLVYSARSILRLISASDELLDSVDQLLSVVLISAPLIVVWGLLRARLGASTVVEVVRVGDRPTTAASLETALGHALGDPTLRLRIADGSGGWTDASHLPIDPAPDEGRGVTTVVDARGLPRASLEHDAGLDQAAVDAAAAAAGMALENEALRAQVATQLDEVQASRARIVEAGYRERRRVERDLHDGAQQRLLSVALALRLAQREVESGADAAPTIAQASDELRLAIDELRELARGIHPSILTDAGLGPAVRALADRCPVTVTDLRLPHHRFLPGVEATVYFVVAEALANVIKHARASRMSIRIEADGDALLVAVVDDGVGGAAAGTGSGLRGLQDRVEAAGGTLTVTSPTGGGTRIDARLPLADQGAPRDAKGAA